MNTHTSSADLMTLVVEPVPESNDTEILLTTVQTQSGPVLMIYTEFDISSGQKIKKDASALSKDQIENLTRMCPNICTQCGHDEEER